MKRCVIVFTSMLTAFALGAQAQVSQTASVLDGSGRRISGGVFTGITAGGQPGGIAVSSAGGIVNYAGFLNTFSLQPALDSDQDGLEDEVDADNDNDTLDDGTELGGGAFDPITPTNPNVADSDGDGTADGEESVAGTDPTDPGAYLRILDIERAGPDVFVFWLGRGGMSYLLHGVDAAVLLPGPVVGTNTMFGGVAPWFVITNVHIEAVGPESDEYYAVEPAP
jgi:hypothetical protein